MRAARFAVGSIYVRQRTSLENPGEEARPARLFFRLVQSLVRLSDRLFCPQGRALHADARGHRRRHLAIVEAGAGGFIPNEDKGCIFAALQLREAALHFGLWPCCPVLSAIVSGTRDEGGRRCEGGTCRAVACGGGTCTGRRPESCSFRA